MARTERRTWQGDQVVWQAEKSCSKRCPCLTPAWKHARPDVPRHRARAAAIREQCEERHEQA